jgi:general secretion pathway protein D
MTHGQKNIVAAIVALVVVSRGVPVAMAQLPPGSFRTAPAPATAAPAPVAPTVADDTPKDHGRRLNFTNMGIDLVLEDYARVAGKTILQHPQTPKANITLKSLQGMTKEEYLQAVETVLAMNGVGILPLGEKFLKVVPIATIRQEGGDVRQVAPTNTSDGKTGEMVSQLIGVYHIDLADALKVVDHLKHPYAQIQSFDRNNTMLVTDTEDNIHRIVQVLKIVDRPIEAREEPFIIAIRNTKASEIKRKLDEMIAEQQKSQQAKPSTVPRMPNTGSPTIVPTIPGVIRARPAMPVPTTPPTTDAEAALAAIDDAERGIVQGAVRIMADDRTNKLIIITRPENMKFFNRIVRVLDEAMTPEVEVKVFRLEFSEAKNIAQMLNELIGAAAKPDAVKPVAGGAPSAPGAPEATPALPDRYGRRPAAADSVAGKSDAGVDARSTALRAIEARMAAGQALSSADGKSKVGELSKENIKILSDERTNSLIIMAARRDLTTLGEIIKKMDIMLSQVLIEAVILDVKLSDEVQTGMDWIQRSMIAYNQQGDGTRRAAAAFTGRLGGGNLTPVDVTTGVAHPTGGGLSYYFTFFGLNVDSVVQMVAKDSRSRVVSTPVILTTDNKEAKITSTDQIYVYSGKKYDQYQNPYDDYTTKDLGLILTVKPHINENKVVMMDISQTMSEPGLTGAPQSGAKVSSQRTLSATIAVRDRQTIVLGGQVREETGRSRTKVPVLGDIPLLGRLFSNNTGNKGRTETVVFITPYVLNDSNALDAETYRRSRVLSISNSVFRGWADSDMQIDKTAASDNRKIRERDDTAITNAVAPLSETPMATSNAAPGRSATMPTKPDPEGAKP